GGEREGGGGGKHGNRHQAHLCPQTVPMIPTLDGMAAIRQRLDDTGRDVPDTGSAEPSTLLCIAPFRQCIHLIGTSTVMTSWSSGVTTGSVAYSSMNRSFASSPFSS